jgi:hypothetical protein
LGPAPEKLAGACPFSLRRFEILQNLFHLLAILRESTAGYFFFLADADFLSLAPAAFDFFADDFGFSDEPSDIVLPHVPGAATDRIKFPDYTVSPRRE